jgi:hypothetical protein
MQWLHSRGRKYRVTTGYCPVSFSETQERKPPSRTPFSALQATEQALQPMQRSVSSTIANRLLFESGVESLALIEFEAAKGPATEAKTTGVDLRNFLRETPGLFLLLDLDFIETFAPFWLQIFTPHRLLSRELSSCSVYEPCSERRSPHIYLYPRIEKKLHYATKFS